MPPLFLTGGSVQLGQLRIRTSVDPGRTGGFQARPRKEPSTLDSRLYNTGGY